MVKSRKRYRVLPCPCCGSKARVAPLSWDSWGVICNSCGLRTERHGDDEDECVKISLTAWNKRVSDKSRDADT